MLRIAWIAAALGVFVGAASADPFTGRYNIESIADSGVEISGWIDFVGVPMGTTTFNLGDASAFRIVASGGGLPTTVYDDLADALFNMDIEFDNALGAPVLTPAANALGIWAGKGDLDGQNDGLDQIELRHAFNSVAWFVFVDGNNVAADFTVGGTPNPPAWKLTIPEPGSALLLAIGVAAILLRRRRKTKNQ